MFSSFQIIFQHGYALELLMDKLKPGGRCLDVGSGSGYLTACFARALKHLGDDPGTVVGIEHHPELVKLSIKNVKSDDQSLIDSGQVILVGKCSKDNVI